MSGACGLFDDLDATVWQGPLQDAQGPEARLLAALDEDAPYGDILRGLRHLWRLDLPGAQAASRAAKRWPGSIDFAVLALDLCPAQDRAQRLAALGDCVSRANRRRAALANAALRHGQFPLAWQALGAIDPASETATDDLTRRAELAIAFGQFDRARADLAALAPTPRRAALELRLVHSAHGARALAQAVAQQMPDPPAAAAAQAFESFLREGDYQRAPEVLARWQGAAPPDDPALLRAQTRLALETGALEDARAALLSRIDPQTPWVWASIEHVLWLRIHQALEADPAMIWAHAQAAMRLAPRHTWLAHVAGFAQEAVIDWRALAPRPAPRPAEPERAMIAARAAQRLGLPARALAHLAALRGTGSVRDAARRAILRAELFWTAGRLQAATRALDQAQALALDRLQEADIAVLRAEIALSRRDPEAAASALAPMQAHFPDRMVLPLTQARIAFQTGDFAAATHAHAQFNRLKAAQIGPFEAQDVRDRITEDAQQAAAAISVALRPEDPVAAVMAKTGPARVAASAGLSAYVMIRAAREGALAFAPAPSAAIPRKIAHFWQGAPGPALERARAQWRKLHPGFTQTLFNAETALEWLACSCPAPIAARFKALSQPALQADFFRLCWIVHEGGIFADLDEYPRLPVTPWFAGAQAVFCIERGFGTVANNFLAAEPGHPICRMALDLVCAALDQTDNPYAWWHSGPAQWTRAVVSAQFSGAAPHVRYLSQAAYNRRVSTNLPYPHKRSADHWR